MAAGIPDGGRHRGPGTAAGCSFCTLEQATRRSGGVSVLASSVLVLEGGRRLGNAE